MTGGRLRAILEPNGGVEERISSVMYRGWVAQPAAFPCAWSRASECSNSRWDVRHHRRGAYRQPAYRGGAPSRASELSIPQPFADEDHDRAGERPVVPKSSESGCRRVLGCSPAADPA